MRRALGPTVKEGHILEPKNFQSQSDLNSNGHFTTAPRKPHGLHESDRPNSDQQVPRHRLSRKYALSLCLVLSASLSLIPCFSAYAGQTTLQDALRHTYETNPYLESQRATQRATDEAVPQAKANWFRPTLSSNGGMCYTYDKSSAAFNSASTGGQQPPYTAKTHTPDAEVSLSLPIFMSGQTKYGIQEAEAEVDVGQWNLVASEQSILSQAATAYAQIVLYEGLVAVAQQELDAYLPLKKMTESMFKSRTSTITDLAQVKSEVAQSKAYLATNKGTLETYRATYFAIIGKEPQDLAPLPTLEIQPATLTEAEELALKQNPLIRSAEYSVHQSQFDIKGKKATLLPTIEATASYSADWARTDYNSGGTTGFQKSDSQDGQVNLVATIPLYSGGVKYSYIRQSIQENIANQRSLKNVIRTQVGTLQGAWHERESQIEVVKAYEDAIGSARTAVTGKIHEFKNGTTSMQEVINAQETLYNVLSQRAQASYNLFITELSILQSLGSLTATGLSLNVPIYNPEDYLEEVRNRWVGW